MIAKLYDLEIKVESDLVFFYDFEDNKNGRNCFMTNMRRKKYCGNKY